MHTSTMQRPAEPVWDAAPLNAPPTVACFGRYEVLAPLGEGGAGRVYVGQTRGPAEARRLVALKHFTSDSPHRELLLAASHEARLGARIRHSNVVGVIEVDDGGIGPFIVMEYVEGGSLVELLSRCFERSEGKGGLPVAIAIRIVLDGLFGLHAAHQLRDEQGRAMSLVHRDVSPHNILVGVDGGARISDFGIARLRHAIRTAPGLVRGKAGYLAPEQVLGQPLDRRTDVFAMGIVLWESLTGTRLFRGKTVDATFASVLEQPILRPSQVVASLSAAIDEVCMVALNRDPRKRWSSARAFADALTAAARGTGPDALATQGEVADYVESSLGDIIERRRALVRLAEANELGVEEFPDSMTVPRHRIPGHPVSDGEVTSEREVRTTSGVMLSHGGQHPRRAAADQEDTMRTNRRSQGLSTLTIVVCLASFVASLAVLGLVLRLAGLTKW